MTLAGAVKGMFSEELQLGDAPDREGRAPQPGVTGGPIGSLLRGSYVLQPVSSTAPPLDHCATFVPGENLRGSLNVVSFESAASLGSSKFWCSIYRGIMVMLHVSGVCPGVHSSDVCKGDVAVMAHQPEHSGKAQ